MVPEIETIKASQLEELTEVTDSNYVVVTDGATSKKVKATKLKGNSLTATQTQQLSAAYTHSQTNHVKFTDIPSLDGYATENFVTTKIAEAALNGSEIDLSRYATKDDLTSKVDKVEGKSLSANDLTNELKSNYDKAYLHSQSTHVRSSDIPTKVSDLQNDSGFITAIPDEYVTETELEAKGYQTITDENLTTTNKTIVTAINELNNMMASINNAGYQTITDENLTTTNKTIVTAINELNSMIASLLDRIENLENQGGTGGGTTIPVTGISLSTSTLNLIEGNSSTLTAIISPTNATNQNVVWSTNDSSVATVSNGVVTAVSAGSATITASTVDGNYTANCSITVSASTVGVTGSYVTDENGNRLMTEDGSYLITD